MPQSLSKVIVHIIFSTKHREGWLDLEVRDQMHRYLATIDRDMDAEVFCVGGVLDHIHCVSTLPRTVTQSQFIEELKTTSSKWIKTVSPKYRDFAWQRGFGIFSVSVSQLGIAMEYVHHQEEHHRTQTFQEEFREFCRRHGVEFDERYVWD